MKLTSPQKYAIKVVRESERGAKMSDVVQRISTVESITEEGARRIVRILIQRGLLQIGPDFRLREKEIN